MRDSNEKTLLWFVIIPGPGEPSSLNPYLVPLISELKELWEDGIEVCHSGSPTVLEKFFAAVWLVACDVLAARTLCGFLSEEDAQTARKNSFQVNILAVR